MADDKNLTQVNAAGAVQAADILPVVQTGTALRRATAQQVADFVETRFSSRAAAVTAIAGGWAPINNAVYEIGSLKYRGQTGATAIADMPGLIPHGDITPNHWLTNALPGVTNMATAIQLAEDYRASVSAILSFPDRAYRCNTALRIRTNGAVWISDRQVSLEFYTAAGTDCILVAGDDATTPGAPYINVRLTNIAATRVLAGSTSAVWRFRRAAGTLTTCAGYGGFNCFLFEGCRNFYAINCLFDSVAFAGGLDSAGCKITSLTQSDSSILNGFTVIWHGLLAGGANYDHGFWIESNDYTIIDTYIGKTAKNRVYINPTVADHYVYNAEIITGTYADGATWPIPTGDVGVRIKGSASTPLMDHINLNGAILANLEHGVVIENASPVKHVNLNGCDLHNFGQSAIVGGTAPNLRLNINGGNISRWDYDADSTALNVYAIQLADGDTLQVQNVNFESRTGAARPAIDFNGFNSAQISDCIGTNLSATPVTYTATTNVQIKNNLGAAWPLADTALSATYNPVISFAGNSVGLTYGFRGSDVRVEENGWVDYNAYILLSAKGTSTGELRINLPFTAIAGNPWVMAVRMNNVTPPANCIGYTATVNGGAGHARVFAHLSTGGTVALTDANIGNATDIILTGRYRRA